MGHANVTTTLTVLGHGQAARLWLAVYWLADVAFGHSGLRAGTGP